MKNTSMPPPLVLFQRTRLRFPAFAIQALLALIALQLPVVGYCDSGNGWFKNLFESKGKNMKELVLTREVIIKDESGFVPEPHVMSRTDDGGFIIAGSLGRAWAIKINTAGKVLWRNLQPPPRADGGYAAVFTGIVAMPDGSTYLCGNMSLPEGYTPSLLIHLDAAGHLIDEQIFAPQKRSEHGISYFDDCVRWGDGVALIGHVHDTKRQASGYGAGFLPPITEQYYWLVMLDAAGKIKWEKQIPTAFDTIDEAQSILVSDSSLVLAGYRMGNTELFRISATGELSAKKNPVDGFFAFVRPIVPDGVLQLYGLNQTNKSFESITLDDRFEEIKRVQGDHGLDFGGRFVYRMPDQSLVLFGGELHERYKSAVAHLDSKLQSVQKIELVHGAQFYDGSYIGAAAPTGNDGEFVTVKPLTKHQPDEGRIGLAPVGLSLYFFQVK